MSWHNFYKGETVAVEDIVAVIQKHINSGKVQNTDEKKRYLDEIANCGHSHLIFSPQGGRWGSSPMNPRSWLTKTGNRIK